ncbi:MAG TPA: gas vesicle protein GvpK [Streptosporangiaceae bacterium]
MIQRLDELCEHFDLSRDELNLDLGPLGPLRSRE